MPAPANDNWANAEVISSASGSASGDNTEATSQVGEPIPSDGGGDGPWRSIWFRWVAPASDDYYFSTEGSRHADASGMDTVLGIYTGVSLASLVEVASNDDYGPFSGDDNVCSLVTFSAVSGTTYFIQVSGYWDGEFGDIALAWDVYIPTPPPPHFFQLHFKAERVVEGSDDSDLLGQVVCGIGAANVFAGFTVYGGAPADYLYDLTDGINENGGLDAVDSVGSVSFWSPTGYGIGDQAMHVFDISILEKLEDDTIIRTVHFAYPIGVPYTDASMGGHFRDSTSSDVWDAWDEIETDLGVVDYIEFFYGGSRVPDVATQNCIRDELLADAPTALWMFRDAPGSTEITDETGNGHPLALMTREPFFREALDHGVETVEGIGPLTVNVPAGVEDRDWLVLALVTQFSASFPTIPGDWTYRADYSSSMWVFTKVWNTGEDMSVEVDFGEFGTAAIMYAIGNIKSFAVGGSAPSTSYPYPDAGYTNSGGNAFGTGYNVFVAFAGTRRSDPDPQGVFGDAAGYSGQPAHAHGVQVALPTAARMAGEWDQVEYHAGAGEARWWDGVDAPNEPYKAGVYVQLTTITEPGTPGNEDGPTLQYGEPPVCDFGCEDVGHTAALPKSYDGFFAEPADNPILDSYDVTGNPWSLEVVWRLRDFSGSTELDLRFDEWGDVVPVSWPVFIVNLGNGRPYGSIYSAVETPDPDPSPKQECWRYCVVTYDPGDSPKGRFYVDQTLTYSPLGIAVPLGYGRRIAVSGYGFATDPAGEIAWLAFYPTALRRSRINARLAHLCRQCPQTVQPRLRIGQRDEQSLRIRTGHSRAVQGSTRIAGPGSYT